jgi:hypothetical protein
MARAARQPLDLTKHAVPDRIEERVDQRALRWTMILTWFMRLLAMLWILKGLTAWAVILGVFPPAGLEGRGTGYQATIIYFAVIDLVAAVGLWMASTWGGVLWLLAVMSHIILAVFFPRIVSGGPITLGVFSALIGIYLIVSWLSAREEQ